MLLDRYAAVGWIWRRAVRPVLFRFDAETTHDWAKRVFSGLMKVPGCRWLTDVFFRVKDSRLHVRRFGLDFPNPVGLAAGLDKNAEWFDPLQTLGFGFIE